MKIPTVTIVAVLVGAALGALGSEALKAQVPPAAFVVGEIDVENAPAYFKEYVPVAAQAVVDGGGKYVVRNGKSVSLYGEPPKALAIMQFESLATAQAVFGSKAYTEFLLRLNAPPRPNARLRRSLETSAPWEK